MSNAGRRTRSGAIYGRRAGRCSSTSAAGKGRRTRGAGRMTRDRVKKGSMARRKGAMTTVAAAVLIVALLAWLKN